MTGENYNSNEEAAKINGLGGENDDDLLSNLSQSVINPTLK
jgi:hypothetical protein